MFLKIFFLCPHGYSFQRSSFFYVCPSFRLEASYFSVKNYLKFSLMKVISFLSSYFSEKSLNFVLNFEGFLFVCFFAF